MLPSSKRLTTPLFKSVMDKGKIFHSSLFNIKLLKIEGKSLFSVAVPKKIAKNAVDRNRIRRQVYSALSSFDKKISSGFYGVLIIKALIIKSTFDEILSGLESLFVKTGLLK